MSADMNSDAGLLAHLQAALDQRGVYAWVDRDGRALPVLFVPIPGTSLREMVIVTYGQRGQDPPHYQWDERVCADAGVLAAALAEHVAASTPPGRPRGWSR